jgi:DNA-binding CsgD family transcriptional regulator
MSRSSAPLALSDAARRELELVAASQASPLQEIRRARALLLAADGLSNVAVADRCGFTPRTIASLRARFDAQGVAALRWDRRGRVPPVEIDGELIGIGPGGTLVVDGRPARVVGIYVTPAQRAIATATGHEPEAAPAAAPAAGELLLSESSWGGPRQFLSFLKTIDREVNKAHDIVLLLDRWPGHVDHSDVDRWLAHPRRSRFHLHLLRSPAWQRVAAHPLGQAGHPGQLNHRDQPDPRTRRPGDDGRSPAPLARL